MSESEIPPIPGKNPFLDKLFGIFKKSELPRDFVPKQQPESKPAITEFVPETPHASRNALKALANPPHEQDKPEEPELPLAEVEPEESDHTITPKRVMDALEKQNREPGSIGLTPSFGEGDRKLFVHPVPGSIKTQEGDMYNGSQYLIVSQGGFHVVEFERNDGGHRAHDKMQEIMAARRKSVSNYGIFPAIEKHGAELRDGEQGKVVQRVIIGADNKEWRHRIEVRPDGFAINGYRWERGARLFPVAGNADKLAPGIIKNLLSYQDLSSQ